LGDFLLSGKAPLKLGKTTLCPPVMVTRLDLFDFRSNRERRKPMDDADLASAIGRSRNFGFKKDRGIIFNRTDPGYIDLSVPPSWGR
jgi:hypothetical protein